MPLPSLYSAGLESTGGVPRLAKLLAQASFLVVDVVGMRA
jgi:hypothetical protein